MSSLRLFKNDGRKTIEGSDKAKKDRNTEKKTNERAPTFWKGASARQVKMDDLSPDDIIIAVMGPTGSGKSTFINTITGFETGVGHTLESCTNKISAIRLSIPELADGDLVFVDTPGFDDTHKSDVVILKMVAEWLKSTYEKDILLSGLLYFHRISDNRMAGTPLKNLRMFEELCGKNAFQNIILATTMWDEVDAETGEAREKELKTKYWRTMLERNSTTSRFMRTRESALALIDPLIDKANIRISVLLQKEMVDMRKKLPATSAGQELFSTMEELVRKREDLLHRIRTEMKRADGDAIALEPLQEEHAKLQGSLESTVKEMQRLKLPLGRRLVKMTTKFTLKFFKSMMLKFPTLDSIPIPAIPKQITNESPLLPNSRTESKDQFGPIGGKERQSQGPDFGDPIDLTPQFQSLVISPSPADSNRDKELPLTPRLENSDQSGFSGPEESHFRRDSQLTSTDASNSTQQQPTYLDDSFAFPSSQIDPNTLHDYKAYTSSYHSSPQRNNSDQSGFTGPEESHFPRDSQLTSTVDASNSTQQPTYPDSFAFPSSQIDPNTLNDYKAYTSSYHSSPQRNW